MEWHVATTYMLCANLLRDQGETIVCIVLRHL